MTKPSIYTLLLFVTFGGVLFLLGREPSVAEKSVDSIAWPKGLPVYDHIVIVVEENKDYDQIIRCHDHGRSGEVEGTFINITLRRKAPIFTRMYGEEHHSQVITFGCFPEATRESDSGMACRKRK